MVLAISERGEVSQTLFNSANPEVATPPNAGNFVFTSSTPLQYTFESPHTTFHITPPHGPKNGRPPCPNSGLRPDLTRPNERDRKRASISRTCSAEREP